ncbi:unnamed protein product [Auanema sp. JU1783]|nr:unnamed protein product [Auanema sp. JU1783]
MYSKQLLLFICLLYSIQLSIRAFPLESSVGEIVVGGGQVTTTALPSQPIAQIRYTDLTDDQIDQISYILETLLYSWRDKQDALDRLTELANVNVKDEEKKQKVTELINRLVNFVVWLNARMQYPDITVKMRQFYETLVALICDKTFIKMKNSEKLTSMLNTIESFDLSTDEMSKIKTLIEKDSLEQAHEMGLLML